MAAIREEIQLHEESLEEFSDGLEVKENKLEKIFYIDEQCKHRYKQNIHMYEPLTFEWPLWTANQRQQ